MFRYRIFTFFEKNKFKNYLKLYNNINININIYNIQ